MQIKRYALSMEEGALLATREFLPFAERDYIDRATGRLVKTQFFERVANGVFRIHRESNKPVTVHQIAEFKAKSFGRIAVSLGSVFTERVREKLKVNELPVEVFATTGHSSSFRFKGKMIYMKGMAKRKIALGETPAGRTMRDLWLLGEREFDEKLAVEVEKELQNHGKNFVHCKHLMPQWLTDRLRKPFINYANRESVRPFQKKLWQLYSPIFKGESQIYFDNSKLNKTRANSNESAKEDSLSDKLERLRRFVLQKRPEQNLDEELDKKEEREKEAAAAKEAEVEQEAAAAKEAESETDKETDAEFDAFESALEKFADGILDEEKERWLHLPESWDDDQFKGKEPDD